MIKEKDEDLVLSSDCIKRIIKDVRYLYKNPLHDNGIYYKHDENNLLTGYAMIIGPSETPYENGYYFFKFIFSNDYPFKPPTLEFMKNPYNIRFHPNFYRNGKVCLSILNTWRGDQWTSCQSISSILLTICSVMNNNPLTNEPGVSESHKDNNFFNKIITYQNLNFSLIDILNGDNINNDFKIFNKEIINIFKNNETAITNRISELKKKFNKSFIQNTNIYSMSINIDYSLLSDKYSKMKKKILTEN